MDKDLIFQEADLKRRGLMNFTRSLGGFPQLCAMIQQRNSIKRITSDKLKSSSEALCNFHLHNYFLNAMF